MDNPMERLTDDSIEYRVDKPVDNTDIQETISENYVKETIQTDNIKLEDDLVKSREKQKKVVEIQEGKLPELSPAQNPEFDTTAAADALTDSPVEGGVSPVRSTRASVSMSSDMDNGNILKPQPDMNADSIKDKYEITGFTVQYEIKTGTGMISVQIRDYFDDLETAFLSVSGARYLMPMPKGGFKKAVITEGAPVIAFNERQIYIYKDNQWVRY